MKNRLETTALQYERGSKDSYAVDNSVLLHKIATGDTSAFSNLFDVYKQQVYAYAMHFTHSQLAAEEIVQDVFVKIWLLRERLSKLEKFEAYLYVTTRNISFNVLKKIAREQTLKNSWNTANNSSHNTAPGTIMERECKLVLEKALEQLSPQQRMVYILRSDYSLDNEEIANRLKISPATVKVHLKRGTRTVRAYFSARKGITWSAEIIILINLFFK